MWHNRDGNEYSNTARDPVDYRRQGGSAPSGRLVTAEDVHSFVSGHVRWLDGTSGPAIELEDVDFTTVAWHFVLRAMHAAL